MASRKITEVKGTSAYRRKKWQSFDGGSKAARQALARFARLGGSGPLSMAVLGRAIALAAPSLALPPATAPVALRVWRQAHVTTQRLGRGPDSALEQAEEIRAAALAAQLTKAAGAFVDVFGRPASAHELCFALESVANGAWPESPLLLQGDGAAYVHFEVELASARGVADRTETLAALAVALGASERVFRDADDHPVAARVTHLAATVDGERSTWSCTAPRSVEALLLEEARVLIDEAVVDVVGEPRSLEWAARTLERRVNDRRERFAPWLDDVVLFTTPPLPMSRVMAHFAVHPLYGRSDHGFPDLQLKIAAAAGDEVEVSFQRLPFAPQRVRKADLRWVERVACDNAVPPDESAAADGR